ncbi:MAG: malto-oligosyltrehalose trehalohydrolase [Actinobacteria bacterium HGW-Actinobacteria-4]|nr:MAG: malto-oligosyltrehalose trehalohydrolase [Actinobacteria bacterium HGW-Actinobacteria-4]
MRARVWAPNATEVMCVTDGTDGRTTHPMSRVADAGDGWWEGPQLAMGTDYGFMVDGHGPYPDPRSAWQPDGVHGLSRVFDASEHRWMDSQWAGRDARGAVTYELHVGTFTPQGTLDAAAGQLRDLAAQGIEMVELMPLAPFPGQRGWGYDGVSLYAVHEVYGGPAALQRFVDKAHQRGIAVCLDVVYNHLGPDGNYLAAFGPYFTDAHETPWGWAVNLDQDHSAPVRDYFIDNALRWFDDFHIDALRLDAVHALRDNSDHHLLAQLSIATAELAHSIGRPLSLVAESDLNDDAMVTPVSEGGLGMTAQWADDVHHALHAYLTGERHGYYVDFGSIETLDHVYRHVFWHHGTYSPFRGTAWGKPVAPDRDRRQFVVFASNHDQVGNRAIGDRPASSLSPGAQATSLAMILLSPFTPMLFMGEEYGETRPFMYFTDHDEPLGSQVSEGRMAEFDGHGWEELYGGPVAVPDPQDRTTFLRSKLGPGLGASGKGHDDLRRWYLDVIAARQRTLDATAWQQHPVGVSEAAPRVVTMHGPVSVHANLTGSPAVVTTGEPIAMFGPVTWERIGSGEAFTVTLGPDAVALVAH